MDDLQLSPEEFLVRSAAEDQGVDPDHMARMAKTESGFDQSAVSPKGARGVMQLMPGTAEDLGVDPTDAAANIKGGVYYFRTLLDRFGGDYRKATAAYNAGPEKVASGKPLPKETEDYVNKIVPGSDELSVSPEDFLKVSPEDFLKSSPVARGTDPSTVIPPPLAPQAGGASGLERPGGTPPAGLPPAPPPGTLPNLPRPTPPGLAQPQIPATAGAFGGERTFAPTKEQQTAIADPQFRDLMRKTWKGFAEEIPEGDTPAEAVGLAIARTAMGAMSPESLATMIAAGGAAQAFRAAANAPRIAALLKNSPQVAKALDIVANTAIPGAFGVQNLIGAGKSGTKAYQAIKAGDQNQAFASGTEAAVNLLFAGLAGAGVKEGTTETTKAYAPAVTEVPARPLRPVEAALAQEIGITPEARGTRPAIPPEQAAATAGALEQSGRRLAAIDWRKISQQGLPEPIPIEINGEQATIESMGRSEKGRPFFKVVGADGRNIFGGTGAAVQEFLGQRGASPREVPPEVAAATAAPELAVQPEEFLKQPVTGETKQAETPAAPAIAPEIKPGASFELPTGTYSVTKIEGGKVSFDQKLPDGTVIPGHKQPLSLFTKMVSKASPVVSAAASGEQPTVSLPEPTLPSKSEAVQSATEPKPEAPATPEKSVDEKQPEKKEHDYSSTQVNLPTEYSDAFHAATAKIPDSVLADEGRETEPHITAFYGLKTNEPADVEKLLEGEGPITAKVGRMSIFPASDKHPDYDVVKMAVESEDLNRLNAKIRKLPNGNEYPEYKPHITVAYVKPGEGKKFAGRSIEGLTGKSVTFNSLSFMPKSGEPSDIALKAQPQKAQPTVAPSEPPSSIPEKPAPPGPIPSAPWMNRWDVESAVDKFKSHPVLSRATKFLQDFVEEVDSHSDGWPYWKLPAHAAGQLQGLIQHPEYATEANFKKALAPIRAFYTKRGNAAGMKFPEIAPAQPSAAAATPGRQQEPQTPQAPTEKSVESTKTSSTSPNVKDKDASSKTSEGASVSSGGTTPSSSSEHASGSEPRGRGEDAEDVAKATAAKDAFRMGGKQLAALAEKGDAGAKAEIERRAGKKPTKPAGPKITSLKSPELAAREDFPVGTKVETEIAGKVRQGEVFKEADPGSPRVWVRTTNGTELGIPVSRLKVIEEAEKPVGERVKDLEKQTADLKEKQHEQTVLIDGRSSALTRAIDALHNTSRNRPEDIHSQRADADVLEKSLKPAREFLEKLPEATEESRKTLADLIEFGQGMLDDLKAGKSPTDTEVKPASTADMEKKFPIGSRVRFPIQGGKVDFGIVSRIENHGNLKPPFTLAVTVRGKNLNIDADKATLAFLRGDKFTWTDKDGDKFYGQVWDGTPNEDGKIRMKVGQQTFNANPQDLTKSNHTEDRIEYAKAVKPQHAETSVQHETENTPVAQPPKKLTRQEIIDGAKKKFAESRQPAKPAEKPKTAEEQGFTVGGFYGKSKAAEAPTKSYKAEIQVHGDPKWYDNALRFATKEEAEGAGLSKFQNWMQAREYRVVESDEPATHKWDDAKQRAESLPSKAAPTELSPTQKAAAEAKQRMADRMATRKAEGPIRSSRIVQEQPQAPREVDPEDLMDLAAMGASHMVDAQATTYPEWARLMTADAGGMIDFAAQSAKLSPDELLRQVYGISTEVASEYGVQAEPVPEGLAVPAGEKPKLKTGATEQEQPEGATGERPAAEDTGALEGSPSEDVRGPGKAGTARKGGNRGGRKNGGPVSGTDEAGNELRPGDRGGVPGVVSPSGRKGSTQPDVRSGSTPSTSLDGDYSLTEEQADAITRGGARTKARNNLEALRTIKTIQAENNRPATPEEQTAIAKYVGWGDSELANGIFNNRPEWAGINQELKDLLTPAEYDSARDSTINAHYTRLDLARAMWDAVARLGFRAGGTLIEPGMGIGNFFITMPDDLKPTTSRTGIEMDLLSGAMARALYPGSNIVLKPYQETNLPSGYFDAAIGNVPFAKMVVNDPEFRRTPFLTQNLHNYFFAKTMNRLRPGGVMAMITSRYSMDGKDGAAFRRWMGKEAELLGAIRLPRDTFLANAGTSVTADVLFLRKRVPGGIAAGADEKWEQSVDTKMEDGSPLSLNEYFKRHPKMMLGEMKPGTQYHRGYPELFGEFSIDKFKKLVDKLPADVIPSWISPDEKRGDVVENYPDAKTIKDGQYLVKDGALVRREGAYFKPTKLSGKRLERALSLIGIRDAAREVIRTQGMEAPEQEILAARKELNRLYDRFVKRNGPINSRANVLTFADDPDWPLLSSLEDFDKKSNLAKKRQIFSERTIQKPKRIEHVETGPEAMAVSLNDLARLDWDRMQELTGRTPEELQKELAGKIFHNPIARRWETADEYLSGNVRKKLTEAEFSAEQNEDYKSNVEALKAVQPIDKEPGQIGARLGANWIPDRYYSQFLSDIFKAEGGGFVNYVPQTGGYGITRPNNFTDAGAVVSKYTTPYFDGVELFEMGMNGKTPVARDTFSIPGGGEKTVKNPVATVEANEKLREIHDEFQKWLWSDPARKDALAQKYNLERNNIRLREYDGSHLTLPGLNRSWLRTGDLDPHQKNAVWRIIQSGNSLLAHAVGAGKTVEIIAAAMELRRLGLARKPMVVVPNHLVEQWKDAYLLAYPGAQILVPTKKEFDKGNRQKLMTRIATGNYDSVIVGMNSFGKLPVKDETYQAFMDEQLKEINDALEAASAGMSKKDMYANATIKQLVRRKASLEAKLEKRLKKEKKDNAIFFEDLGVDHLFVDEFHHYKNLGYMTQMDRIAGLPNSDADRATDMLLKSQYVTNLHGGSRGLVGATGTPVSNSIAEIWTMMRYLMLPYLKQENLDQFDAWAKTFGNTITQIEVAPEGGRFMPRTRFADFMNVGALQNIFRLVADIRTKKQLNLPTPAIWKGGPQEVISPASDELKHYIELIGERADAIRAGDVEPEEDNMLKISSDGRKASLDMRLVDPRAPEHPDSKVNTAVQNILEVYREFGEHKAAQLLFLDLSTPKSEKVSKRKQATSEARIANVDQPAPEATPEAASPEADTEAEPAEEKVPEIEQEGLYGEAEEEPEDTETAEESRERFTVYSQIKKKLVAGGIPPEKIAFIHDADTDAKKTELFRQVNAGEVRVLLGSTEKMGAGMNVQERLIAAHNLDAPWRPSDLEQRNGRIDRQGNKLWDEHKIPVRIYNYATEGSFDAFMWETILSKARPIERFMEGDPSMDRIEELSPMVLSYEQIKANSSGNPLIRDKILVDQEVNKLEIMRGAWMSEQSKIAGNLAQLPGQIQSLKEDIANLGQDQETRDSSKALVVGGQSYEKEDIRKDGAKALLDKLRQLGEIEKKTATGATYRGFKLAATPQTEGESVLDDPVGRKLYIREVQADGKLLYSEVGNVPEQYWRGAFHRDEMRIRPVNKDTAVFLDDLWNDYKKMKQQKWDTGRMSFYTLPGLSLEAKSNSLNLSVNYNYPRGVIDSADHQVDGIEEILRDRKNSLQRAEKGKVELESQAGEPFKGDAKLKDALRRQNDLAEKLGENQDDAQALGAKEDEEKQSTATDPKSLLLKDPTSAMAANWFPKRKYFVAGYSGRRTSESGYQISKQLAVRKVERGRQEDWVIDRTSTGETLGIRPPNEVQAVAFARQLSRNIDWAVPQDELKEAISKQWQEFTPPTETPEQSLERIAPQAEAARAAAAATGGIPGYTPVTERKTPQVRSVWSGNAAKEGSLMTDGAMAIEKSAIKDKNKLISLAVKNQGASYPKEAVENFYNKSVAEATKPLTEIGVKDVSSPGSKKDKTPVAFYASADGTVHSLNADRAKLLQVVTGATELRGGEKGKPVVFYAGGKPVAMLAQTRATDAEPSAEEVSNFLGQKPDEPIRQSRMPGFYSQLERTIEGKMPAKASPEQVLGILRNPQSGVKPDEMKWTGITEWLAKQTKPVTKPEVLEQVRQNAVQVEEVHKGGNRFLEARRAELVAEGSRLQAEYDDLNSNGADMPTNEEIGQLAGWTPNDPQNELERIQGQIDTVESEIRELDNPPSTQELEPQIRALNSGWSAQEIKTAKRPEDQPQLDRLLALWEIANESERPTPTKFSQYTLPGGKNYRELLLTLPPPTEVPAHLQGTAAELEQIRNRMYALETELGTQGVLHSNEYGTLAERYDRLHDNLTRLTKSNREKTTYKSPHWDEPNVLAHVRLDDRTAPDGKKVLMVEEIQSDWHQEGKRKGYRTDAEAPKPVLKIENDFGSTQIGSQYSVTGGNTDASVVDWNNSGWHDSRRDFPTDAFGVGGRGFRASIQNEARNFDSKQEAMGWAQGRVLALHQKIANQKAGFERGVPQAPFAKSWHELAFRRVLRYAAENGYDRVSWTTGEQQAERYDLSKQISKLHYSDDGILTAFAKNDPNDEVIRKAVPENELPDVIGKEAAQKLMEQPIGKYKGYRELKGLDLKVGGHGMSGFYDKILPDYANKYAKKWGAKTGETKIKADKVGVVVLNSIDALVPPDADLVVRPSRDGWGVYDNSANEFQLELLDEYDTEREALDYARKIAHDQPKMESVHSIDVTPSMRESVMQGQPLFQRGAPTQTSSGPSKYRNGILWVSGETMQAITQKMNVDPARGLYVPPARARDLAKVVTGTGLNQAVAQALRDARSLVIVRRDPGESLSQSIATARHELFHQSETWAAGPRRGNELLKDPLAQKAADSLAKAGYDKTDIPILWSEIGAHLAAGPVGWDTLGLDREEAKQLFKNYLNLLEPQDLSKLKRIAPQLNEELHAARAAAQSRIAEVGLDRRGSGADEEVEGRPGQGPIRSGIRPALSREFNRNPFESQRRLEKVTDLANALQRVGVDSERARELSDDQWDKALALANAVRAEEAKTTGVLAKTMGNPSRLTKQRVIQQLEHREGIARPKVVSIGERGSISNLPTNLWEIPAKTFRAKYPVHFDLRDNAADRVESMMKEGLKGKTSMGSPDWDGSESFNYVWSQGAAKAGSHAYVFAPDAWATKREAYLKQGAKPIAHTVLEATEPVHKALVRDALRQKKYVPRNVLAEYPDLAEQFPQKPGERGTAPLDFLTLGGAKLVEKDIAPTVRNLASHVAATKDDIARVLAPASRGPIAKEAALTVRQRAAELARATDRAEATLELARKFFSKQDTEANLEFMDRIETGQRQPDPQLQGFATLMRDVLDDRRKQVQDLGTGKLQTFYEDYFPHIWKKSDDAQKAFKEWFAKRPMEGSKSFLKKRTIPTIKDGIDMGLEPESTNPVDLVLAKIREQDKYLFAHHALDDLKETGVLKFVRATERAPEGFAKINDNVATVYEGKTEQGSLAIRGAYWAPEPAAEVINNYLSPGLRKYPSFRAYMGLANILNQFQLGWSAYHLGFTSFDSAVSRVALGIMQTARGNPIKGLATAASFPLAPFRGIWQGDKLLKEWYKPGTQGSEIGELVDAMTLAGGRARMDRFYRSNVTQKMMDALKQGNLWGAALRAPFALTEQAARPILEYVVPRQKMAVFADLARLEFERLESGQYTPQQFREALAKAWDSVDNRLGQLIYDNLFWNKAHKDLAMASVRSVGWNLGTIREILGGGVDSLEAAGKVLRGKKPEVTSRMAYILALPIVAGLIGGLLHYLNTHEHPAELKDYFFPRRGPRGSAGWSKRMTLPSYVKDVVHYAHDPMGTIRGKIHPLLSLIMEMLSNKDYFDRPIRNPHDPLVKQMEELAKHVGTTVEPLAVRPLLNPPAKGAKETTAEKLLPFIGVTEAPKYIKQDMSKAPPRYHAR